MKKLLVWVLLLTCVIAFTACGSTKEIVSGEVVTYYAKKDALVVKDGLKEYGFVITDKTELVWSYGDWRSLGPRLLVDIEAGAKAKNPLNNETPQIKAWYYAEKVTVTGENYAGLVDEKPVIHLYPETETDVEVKLDYTGQLTCTYPKYEDGWHVTAQPDGTLTDGKGQQYNYLYWEGSSGAAYDLSEGFCVAGADTAAFLEEALAKLGLNRREANEFMVYWLPLMEQNAYNLISFQSDVYTQSAKLTVTPTPDTVIRVFMAWQGLETAVEVPAQALTAPERTGFTVIEWGGAEVTGG